MKKILGITLLFFLTSFAYAQSPPALSIPISRMEKFITNPNLFRVSMLENGFVLSERDSNEVWIYLLQKQDEGYIDPDDLNSRLAMEMYGKSKWQQSSKFSYSRYDFKLEDRTVKFLRIQLRKDLLPINKIELESNIKAYYKIKKAIPVQYGKDFSKTRYELRYSNPNSLIYVDVDDSEELWFEVTFALTKWNRP